MATQASPRGLPPPTSSMCAPALRCSCSPSPPSRSLSSVVTGRSVNWNRNDTWAGVAFVAWLFVYFAYSWAASGKTFGMAVLGVRVTRSDGADAGTRRAVVRTLALPLSFLFFGLGFVGIILGRRRRALHDVIAGTIVIYSWDARAARLRFLSRTTTSADGAPARGHA